MGIKRCPHDRENPYVQLNKHSLWDENLSLEAVGLWARLMSRPDDWEFNVAELSRSCNTSPHMINKIINELVSNGYAYRSQRRGGESNGKHKTRFSGWDIWIMERKRSPEEISNILSEGTLSRPKLPDPIVLTLLKKEGSNQEHIRHTKERHEGVPPSSPIGETTPLLSLSEEKIRGRELAERFDKRLQELYPSRKGADIDSWAKDFEKLLRIDKREVEEVKEMLEWVLDHEFWVKNVLSPSTLRKQWDKLMAQKKPPQNKGNRIHWNRVEAREVESYLRSKRDGRAGSFRLFEDRVERLDTKDVVPLDVPHQEFVQKLCQIFEVKRSS